jgi:metal-responsive CopG/Arc/MetJ family transcriptional regulator
MEVPMQIITSDPRHGTPVQVRLHKDLLNALDAFRREQQNPPSRAQAARELIRKALSGDQIPLSEGHIS